MPFHSGVCDGVDCDAAVLVQEAPDNAGSVKHGSLAYRHQRDPLVVTHLGGGGGGWVVGVVRMVGVVVRMVGVVAVGVVGVVVVVGVVMVGVVVVVEVSWLGLMEWVVS